MSLPQNLDTMKQIVQSASRNSEAETDQRLQSGDDFNNILESLLRSILCLFLRFLSNFCCLIKLQNYSSFFKVLVEISVNMNRNLNLIVNVLRNIIVPKDALPVKKIDTEDSSEAKYFGKTEAYRTFQMHKSNPEEGFLERMKLRQKERERKRNEIRKFHQLRAEESRCFSFKCKI